MLRIIPNYIEQLRQILINYICALVLKLIWNEKNRTHRYCSEGFGEE